MSNNLVVIEQDKLFEMINQAVQQATAHLQVQQNQQKELPLLLTRKQFMDLVGIGESKCAELFNRRDFPVNREFGHPRVPTALLFEWINRNTEWVKEYAPEFGQKFKVV